jgi:hypothetical protein
LAKAVGDFANGCPCMVPPTAHRHLTLLILLSMVRAGNEAICRRSVSAKFDVISDSAVA